MGIEVTLSGFLSLSLFFSDGCGAGIVCLNVSTLEELHSCGRLDHIGGFTERTDTHTHAHAYIHTDTHTHSYTHTTHSHSDRQPCWAGSSTTQSFYLSVVKPD